MKNAPLFPILILLFALTARVQGQQPALSSRLNAFVEKQQLAGAVALVADGQGIKAVETVGFADIGAGRVMRPDAMFWIASQSKPMTAVAVMMLVDEGKIALNDPVEKYLPEFKGQMVKSKAGVLKNPVHPITVREVLSHMSGLPFSTGVEKPTLDGLPLAEAVRSYAATPLNTEPGTAYRYSNAGINTAARVLEVVSGLSYEGFMQQRLFDPLGMEDTTFWPDESQVRRIANSYRPGKDQQGLVETKIGQLIYPLHDRERRFPMPAGGLFSTAQDTALFCRMLLNGGTLDGRRYLSEKSLAELSRRQTPETVKNSYGLGFAVGGDGFGHGGAHATDMTIYPGKNLVTIWMVQHAGFPGDGGKAQGVFKDWARREYGR